MGKSKLQGTRHAIEQLWNRCSIEATKATFAVMEQTSELLYSTPNGFARLVEYDNKLAVLMIQGSTAVTTLSLEMAFADCPKAVFLGLLATGRLQKAIELRKALAAGKLPAPSPLSEVHYKYQRRKARVLWEVFSWTVL